MRKLIIPDTQVTPDCPIDHMTWIGYYILDQKPDVIIHLGDHFDMHSLSSYDRGKLKAEGSRVSDDIDAGNEALYQLELPMLEYNAMQVRNKQRQYRPDKYVLIGNHEERIMRYVNDNPELDGTLDYNSFHYNHYGWNVHPFLSILDVAGVKYSHYFSNPKSGKPYGGMMETRLKNIGFSFTQGHTQGLSVGMRELGDGSLQRGVVAGSCYLHDEQYRGPQANHEWRGVLVKNECANGQYDLMEVSLNYLCRKYEGIELRDFMMKKYKTVWGHR